MTKSDSPKFTDTTKRIAAKMAGERCSICEEPTSVPNNSRTKFVNKGEAAHIFGANKSNNNRYDPTIETEYLKSISNCLWVCCTCHKHIDSDESEYSANRLKIIKEEHFQRILKGKYGKASFHRIDVLNEKVSILNELIESKTQIINQNERLLNLELNKLNIERANLERERDQLITDYNSLINSSFQMSPKFVEKIYNLVFEKNDLEGALLLLDERELKMQEFSLAKNRVLKGEVHFLMKSYELAYDSYRKAFEINCSFEISSFLIRYLMSINRTEELLEVIQKTIVEEESINRKHSKLLTLKTILAKTYADIDPAKSIELYEKCVEINEYDKDSLKYSITKATLTNHLIMTLISDGKIERAYNLCREQLDFFFRAKFDNDEERYTELCSLYNTIAQINQIFDKNEYAIEYYQHALNIIVRYLPNSLELQTITILNLSNCVSVKNRQEFLILLDRAIENIKTLLAAKPLSYFEMLVGAYCKKADILFRSGKSEEADKELENAENFIEQALLLNKKGFQFSNANFLHRKAMICMQKGNKEKALELIIQSSEIFESMPITEEIISKIALLALVKSTLHTDNKQKIEDLSRVLKYFRSEPIELSKNAILLSQLKQELANLNSELQNHQMQVI